jgi:outer membrane protein assembly factor BamD
MASVWVINKGGLMIRTAALAVLPMVLANWTQLGDTIHRSSDTTEVAETVVDPSDQAAERELIIGRFYMSKLDYAAAINRFKTLVTKYPASPYVEEALARLAEVYLALRIAGEAQTAAAVLDRNFPTSHFSIEAHDALKAVGLDPVEDEKSWISRALK